MDGFALVDQVLVGVLAGVVLAGVTAVWVDRDDARARRFGWWCIATAAAIGVLRLWLASGWSLLELSGLSVAAVAALVVLIAVAAGAVARDDVWTELSRWLRHRRVTGVSRSSSTRSHPPP